MRMRTCSLIAVTCLLAGIARGEQAAGWLSKLSVHGYLSQAYAVSEDHQIFGIPTGGTADYRDVALQFRYDANRKHSAVVQLRHAKFGDSPQKRGDVELDWAFYQHHFSDRFAVKAGRIPLPLGIFNESGGPAGGSPFFRPPSEFYERRYSSKTLEGALASLSLGDEAGWSFDVDGYAGRWKVDSNLTERTDAREAWGAQVWANTPWKGVRLGAGAYRCEVDRTLRPHVDYLMMHASVEADLDRWRLASEVMRGNLGATGRYRAGYAQAGYQFTSRLSVHARGAVAHMRSNVHNPEATLSEDLGLAINFAVHPNVLFKLEGHTNDGLRVEDQQILPDTHPSRTRYMIASLTATY